MATKPSIVFAHGLWADGFCFSKLVPTLQAEGHEVTLSCNVVAMRMKASVDEVASSHVPMLSKPEFVLDVIRAAAKSVKAA
jgi:hypothetical protein